MLDYEAKRYTVSPLHPHLGWERIPKDFTYNHDPVVDRLNAGEAVRIVQAPDSICRPMMVSEEEPHCLRPNVIERDGKAARALETLLGQNPKPGKDLFLDRKMAGRIRHAFAAGTVREACEDCEWSDLCSAVAGTDFDEMYLFPSPEGAQSKDLE